MIILLTGVSSFTGSWFAHDLVARGARVVAPLRRGWDDYVGLARHRLERVRNKVELVPRCPFGSNAFMDLISTLDGPILCHHAAQVANYKNWDFDVGEALEQNTHNLSKVMARTRNLRGIVLTGSVFEQGEGNGPAPREALSPYGLSKTLTRSVFQFWCTQSHVPFTHFVIPNPFGPHEGPSLSRYLFQSWANGGTAFINAPDYMRDHIPVSLLARVYAECVDKLWHGEAIPHLAPSYYSETLANFAQRVAQEMSTRMPWECRVECLPHADHSEPMIRVNTDKPDVGTLGWTESTAWDQLAEFYQRQGWT